ncbi:uncharacterized protein LOC141964540 [Athene noctua]|uniref:uncharacterized protein LOC141964540 n=1 Tax=Athene noctua TaxID=126797 RepID=UPI003EC09B07
MRGPRGEQGLPQEAASPLGETRGRSEARGRQRCPWERRQLATPSHPRGCQETGRGSRQPGVQDTAPHQADTGGETSLAKLDTSPQGCSGTQARTYCSASRSSSTCHRLSLLPAAPAPSSAQVEAPSSLVLSERATAAEAESQAPAPHSPAACDAAVQDAIQCLLSEVLAKVEAAVQALDWQQQAEQQTLAHTANAAGVVPSPSPQNPPAEAGTPHLAPAAQNERDAAASPLAHDSGQQHCEHRDWPCPSQPCLGEALGVGGQAGACLLPALPHSCSFSSYAGMAVLPHGLVRRRRPSLCAGLCAGLSAALPAWQDSKRSSTPLPVPGGPWRWQRALSQRGVQREQPTRDGCMHVCAPRALSCPEDTVLGGHGLFLGKIKDESFPPALV